MRSSGVTSPAWDRGQGRLRENPVAVERIAREQLGLVRKSEVVFQFDRK